MKKLYIWMISIGLVIAIIVTWLIITMFNTSAKKIDIALDTISEINYRVTQGTVPCVAHVEL